MATAEKFCLRWNDFESNISSAFRELREDKDFFDVTLACDDDQIQAHKVILSACSPFFRTVLKRNRHEHPLLYLKGVKYIDLVAVLNFMYHGEVNVAQEELNSFLSIAEELKVKGLTQNNGSENSQSPSPRPPREQKREPPEPKTPQQKRPRPPQQAPQASFHQSMSDPMPEAELRDVEEIAMVKSEPVGGGSTEQQVAEADYMESYENYEGYEEEEGSYDGALLASGGGVDGNKGDNHLSSHPSRKKFQGDSFVVVWHARQHSKSCPLFICGSTQGRVLHAGFCWWTEGSPGNLNSCEKRVIYGLDIDTAWIPCVLVFCSCHLLPLIARLNVL